MSIGMEYILLIVLVIVIILQAFINLYLITLIKKDKGKINSLDENLGKSVKLIVYLMDKINNNNDKINLN